MALYAVKYTRTQVMNTLVEADSEAEAISIDSDGWYDKVKAQGDESNVVVVNSVDTITWTAPTDSD